ncbi:MAG TPA: hypothetical protein VFZ16_21610 [Hyphomicrobiaceae bacterium]|nr:hypothetical protein [Hyphomicrobiaceae bacterium]
MTVRRFLGTLGLVAAAAGTGYAGYIVWLGIDGTRPSVCRGNAVHGSLQDGRRLPYSGSNFRAYSRAMFALGRTFVHSSVRDAMHDAYADLHKTSPELRFVYAETGWPWGGRFRPHRTHANGTSVDFLVPVRTLEGQVSELPTAPWQLFGYAVDFDRSGRSGSRRLDFEAMGAHLIALDKAARAHGIRIRRVIFDVNLQPKLAATKSGAAAMSRMVFNRSQAWVRHDEHYHVDFAVPCR